MARFRITIRYKPPEIKPLVVLVAVLLVALVLLWVLGEVVLPSLGFDGKFGPGCDRGNPNCQPVSPNPEESKP